MIIDEEVTLKEQLPHTFGAGDAQWGLGWVENRFVLEILGRDGYSVVEGLGGSYGVERVTLGRWHPTGGPPEETVEEFSGDDTSWLAEWEDVIGAIREGREPMVNGHDGWQAMRMVSAIYESSRHGRVVQL